MADEATATHNTKKLREDIMFRLTLAVVQAMFLLQSAAFAQHELGDDKEVGRLLWKGVQLHLERLRSGQFEASGKLEGYRNSQKRSEISLHYKSSFDHTRNLVRFDSKNTIILSNFVIDESEAPIPPPKGFEGIGKFEPSHEKVSGGKFACDGKNTIWHAIGTSRVLVEKGDAEVHSTIKSFDVRALPIAYYVDFEKRTPYAELMNTWLELGPYSVTQVDDAVYKLEIIKRGRRTVWIDTSKGYAVTRMEASYKTGVLPNGVTLWDEPWLKKTIDWEQVNDIWVPSRCSMITTMKYPNNDKNLVDEQISLEIKFQWKSVNTLPNPRDFTVDGFGLENGTMVLNNTRGQLIVERIIGKKKVPDYLSYPDLEPPQK